MNEEERAEWLARAIDDLLKADRQRGLAGEPPEGLEAGELKALVRVAKARLDKARDSADAGAQYEGEIWRRVLSRLDDHFGKEGSQPAHEPNWLTNADEFVAAKDLKGEDPSWRHAEVEELREIALLRRRMAEEAASFAEQHRDAVWRRVQTRIQKHPQNAGVFSFFRRLWSTAVRLPAVSDRSSVQPSDDETLDGLIRISRARKEMSGTANHASRARHHQLWDRIIPGLSGQLLGQGRQSEPSRPPSHLWPRQLRYKVGAAAVVAVLIVAAIGPVPATGLANHPAVELARYLGEYAGVAETGAPPAPPEYANFAQGIDASAAEAASLLGVPVVEPATPLGFARTSSQYFRQALSAAEGGMYVLTYGSAGASVVIYQERASGGDIAARDGSAFDVTLVDGTPASYIDGAWEASSTSIEWSDAGSQTLLFDRLGVRTIIRYAGPRVERAFLFGIANPMALTP
jgi:hypothetical protein